uniref:Uncharacterized protein n=1 Tax=Meloidogyne floridensis TaxID=298350 RepID=A0A915P8X2_9BILA
MSTTTIKLFIFFVFIIKIVNCGICFSCCANEDNDENDVGNGNVGGDNQHLVNLLEFAQEGHFDQENEGASSDVDFTTNENTSSD